MQSPDPNDWTMPPPRVIRETCVSLFGRGELENVDLVIYIFLLTSSRGTALKGILTSNNFPNINTPIQHKNKLLIP